MKGRPSANDRTFGWLLQAGLGILLVLLLSAHLVVNHWVAPRGLLAYEDIVRYFSFPGIALMELLFLIFVTTHCLMGLYSILLDLDLSSPINMMFRWVLIAVGITIVLYGFRLTWSLARLSML